MKKIFVIFFAGLLLAFSRSSLLAQTDSTLVINEFSSYSNPGDWVELYNYGPDPVDLSQYRIRDSTDKLQKIDLSGTLTANAFMIVDMKDYLNKTGDIIRLFRLNNGIQEENPLMEVCYGDQSENCPRIQVACYPEAGQTIGSFPSDGGNTFERFSNEDSKGVTNESAVMSPCATPTPTNSPTSSFKPIPTNTPTKIPTSVPISTATIKPIRIPTSIPTTKILDGISVTGAQEMDLTSVLEASTVSSETDSSAGRSIRLGVAVIETPVITDYPIYANKNKSMRVLLPYAFIGIGILVIFFSIFKLYRKAKRDYTDGYENREEINEGDQNP